MKIDVETLRDAFEEMEEFLKICKTEEASTTSENDAHLRAFRTAVVKAFEFTYELAIPLIRRDLSEGTFTAAQIKTLRFRDMVRAAADSGLIADPESWFHYRDIRNITSHVYGKTRTDQVLSIADEFLKDVRFLLAELTRRNSP